MTPKVLKVAENYYYFSTQNALAKYLGVTPSSISNWKKQGKDSAFNGLIKIEDYDPFETDEDDNKYNYCGSTGPVGVKND